MQDLELFYSPYCPYCIKVLRFMKQHDIDIPLHDTHERANLARLLKVGGMDQVPCLFIGDKALYESDDIITYLRKHFVGDH